MNKKLFAAMMRRRVSCPQVTQQLWDAIATIRAQRQVPNMDRISRYMSRVHQINEDEVRRQLNHCVRDNLIRMIKRIGCKGSKIGIEQEGYALPKEGVKDDGHDWYCFSCHRGGDVICCTSCHRVYHLACLARGELPDEDVKNTFVCSVCKDMGVERDDKNRMKRSQLNHLLSFTCSRLRERLPANLCDRTAAPPPRNPYSIPERTSAIVHHHPAGSLPVARTDVQGQSERWRAAFLIYRPMDLKTMEHKAGEGKYRLLEEFRADAMTIVHNVVIYHGVHSSLADMARQMLRDCVYDLTEIRQCRDCYRVSNEKKDKHWFCEPCRPPHQLVYAKQKGFPYWPAKVIKMEGDQYDVRFFGGQHQRAHIEKVHIRPISVNIHTLQVKRTSSWNKACEELRRHQELLKKLESKGRQASSSEDEDDDEDEDEESSEEDDDSETKSPPPKKRGRGRPPKNPAAVAVAEAKKLQRAPRKVGRPRKVVKEEEAKEESDDDEDEEEEEQEEEEDDDDEDEDESEEEEVVPAKRQSAPAAGTRRKTTTALAAAADKADKRVSAPARVPVAVSEDEEHAPRTPGSATPPAEAKPPPAAAATPASATPALSEGGDSSISSTSKVKAEVKVREEEEMVSSSCQEPLSTETVGVQTPPRLVRDMQQRVLKELEKTHADALAKVRAELELERQRAVRQLEEKHAEELRALEARHKQQVSEVKRKQWCYNCESEAIYHCCWNTAYCSIDCQQLHWQKEHKRFCRRKR
ncbi:zinc finger MYND domain-containing protein 11 [Schistocerca cancellata]|uniref:zinc finger MYND domain-containing protein 11 n=1 Tax=Schistocerca cancellata TaxID=274614 RepID=UPI00211933B6|nr:zinc finger MYND domain-containing protein 11 [Schistocerca cancellata]